MRILHLLPHLSKGGAEQQFCYLAPAMVRIGHEVHACFLNDELEHSDIDGVILHRLKCRSNYDPSLLVQIFQLIRRISPDVIQTWILQMDLLGGLAAIATGTPWILREPSSVMAYPPRWKNRLRRAVARRVSAVVSNSQGGDDYWKSMLPKGKRYIVPNALPVDKIDHVKAADAPPLIGINGRPLILYVGRLAADVSANKNLKVLLEAFALVKKVKDVTLVLCGDGPQKAELSSLAERHDISQNVHFTGHLPATSVWALMKASSVFVSLSAYEGCPNAVQEAMACGCPVVLSDIPAHRDLLDDRCARFVDPSDVQEAANVILQALEENSESKQRAEIARQRAQGWSIAEMARSWERIYEEVLASSGRKCAKDDAS